ncbi:MAG: RNA polymerase sigma factor [Planctomycetota bacterium]
MIVRCQQGDHGGFELLHAAHAGRVMAYLLRSGFARHDAEDLCQDVFVRVVKSFGTFDPSRGALGAWIATIARNVARKHWRRASSAQFDPELAEETLASSDDTVAEAESAETIEGLDDCIDRLPGELRKLIRLRYVEGRTTRGIATVVELPEATVRLHLDKAREQLRLCLEAKGIET